MRIIVIDDDHSTHPFVEGVLQENFGIGLNGAGYCIKDGVKLINQVKPDLVFLDINLPDGKGYDLIKDNSGFKVIFITAHDDYAVKAFELAAIDYLLKPIHPERIVEAYNRCTEAVDWKKKYSIFSEHSNQQSVGNRMVIKKTEGFDFINIPDIIYCESDGNYTRIFSKSKPLIVSSKTMSSIEQLLQGCGFFRCHKSYLINTEHIESFKSTKWQIELVNGSLAPLSRGRKKQFMELVERLGIG